MNKNVGIIIGAMAVIVILGWMYIFMNNRSDDVTIEEKNQVMNGGNDSMMKAGFYEAYTSDKLARADTGDVVLFFHASWCPSCRGLNADIEKNMSVIPAGVTILKTDYDKET